MPEKKATIITPTKETKGFENLPSEAQKAVKSESNPAGHLDLFHLLNEKTIAAIAQPTPDRIEFEFTDGTTEAAVVELVGTDKEVKAKLTSLLLKDFSKYHGKIIKGARLMKGGSDIEINLSGGIKDIISAEITPFEEGIYIGVYLE